MFKGDLGLEFSAYVFRDLRVSVALFSCFGEPSFEVS